MLRHLQWKWTGFTYVFIEDLKVEYEAFKQSFTGKKAAGVTAVHSFIAWLC